MPVTSDEFDIKSLGSDIVVIITEGPSDKRYLETPIRQVFKKKYTNAAFIIISDITGDFFYEDKDIVKFLQTFIEGELRNSKFKIDNDVASRIVAVHHIIDIDNAFIDDSLVLENRNITKIKYSHKNIECPNKNDILDRNHLKQTNIYKLYKMGKIRIFDKDVEYHLYYYSINIDDYYFNELNITDEEKNKLGALYNLKLMEKSENGRLKKFYSDISSINPDDYPTEYLKTWEYIFKDNNCLRKCTNVFLIK